MKDSRGDKTEGIRFRVTQDLKEKWEAMLTARKLSLQDAAGALFEWIVSQDALLQAMVFGQVPAADDLARLVLKRLAEKGKGRK